MQVDKRRSAIDLSVLDVNSGSTQGSTSLSPETPAGTVVNGRVAVVSAAGVRVQVGPRLFGTVSVCDIHDGWVQNSLEGLSEGQFVRCVLQFACHWLHRLLLSLQIRASFFVPY